MGRTNSPTFGIGSPFTVGTGTRSSCLCQFSFSPEDTEQAIELHSELMAGRTMLKEKSRAGSFFSATLVLWTVSLWFEILFDRRFELLYLVFGALFYQSANSAIRFLISKEPLVVNTAVSLLHSIITSASGSVPTLLPFVACFPSYFSVSEIMPSVVVFRHT